MKKVILFFLLCTVLCGCTQSIDTSSEEAYKKSIDNIKSRMSEAEQAEFAEALMLVGMKDLSLGDVMSGGMDAGDVQEKMMTQFDGKTVDEILAEADVIKAERERKEREQALLEITNLRKAREEAEGAREALKNFEVSKSRFYKRRTSTYSSRLEPFIELTVRNNTDSPVARAYFVGTIASPGRSIPWHSDAFNYEIPGGLEPGEEDTWVLAPNMFSDWGKVDAPKDAVFTVEVRQLDGADGEPLFSINGFTEDDAERLAELENSYGG